jgi:hypothetical protein
VAYLRRRGAHDAHHVPRMPAQPAALVHAHLED